MRERHTYIAPPIAAIPADEPRPLWSVMIPTYNCARYLAKTLRSVLAQDPGPALMQIEVVDDCSTKDDPESLVREIGRGRFAFFRNPKNVGVTRNFNQCIRRSRGCWVHILHGDDTVRGDFYETMGHCASRYPGAAILAARCLVIDADDAVISTSPRIPEMENLTTDPRPLLAENRLRTPGVVLRRDFYEKHGGFMEELIHAADWEMWCRGFAWGGGFVLDRALACYREFAQNKTSQLARTGDNVRDYVRAGDVFSQEYPYFQQRRFMKAARAIAASQLERFRRLGDDEALQHNQRLFQELGGAESSFPLLIKQLVKSVPILRQYLH